MSTRTIPILTYLNKTTKILDSIANNYLSPNMILLCQYKIRNHIFLDEFFRFQIFNTRIYISDYLNNHLSSSMRLMTTKKGRVIIEKLDK